MKFKIAPWITFACVVLVSTCLMLTKTVAESSESKAASSTLQTQLEQARMDHQLVFELADRFDATYAPNVNIDQDVLSRIDLDVVAEQVEGGVQLVVPAGFERVKNHFDALWIRGKSMHHTVGVKAGAGGTLNKVKWERYGDALLIRPEAMDLSGDGNAVIIVEGDVQPESLRWTLPGLSSRFDASPFLGVGAGREPRLLRVDVSTRRWRSIGGISELDRSRYFRIYSQVSNETYPHHAEELAELNFQHGRQIFKLGPGLEHGYGVRKSPLLKEDPIRPGYADPEFFDLYKDDQYAGVDPELTFAMCLDDWPSFMQVDIPNVINKRGTPKDFDAAADVAARYLKNQVEDSGRTATWWEVKNEGDIPYEWSYHADESVDGWGLLADFHNRVAIAIHDQVDPKIKVGGPAAAWPAFAERKFDRWRSYARFQDETADHLDFYSYHFYYPPVYDSIDPHGYLEARLDMLQSHMHTSGNVKPLLVTEFGVIGQPASGTEDGKAWTKSKGYSSQWMRYLDRPDEFDMVVPFMLGFMHWNPTSTLGVWAKDEDGKFYRTQNYNVMRLWKDFKGRRVPIASEDPRFYQHAVLDGDMLYVALNNETADRILVDLQLDSGVGVASAIQKRFYFEEGSLRYQEDSVSDLSSIPVSVAETTVLAIKLDGHPRPQGELAEQSYYGQGTAIAHTGEPISMKIEVPAEALAQPIHQAQLRVGMHRSNARELGDTLIATVNGQEIRYDLSRFGDEKYFGYARLAIPPDAIEPTNDVAIRFDKPGGTLGSVRLTLVLER